MSNEFDETIFEINSVALKYSIGSNSSCNNFVYSIILKLLSSISRFCRFSPRKCGKIFGIYFKRKQKDLIRFLYKIEKKVKRRRKTVVMLGC